MKVMVATPAYDPMVWAETYAAMVSLDTSGMEIECCIPVGHAVAKARTIAAEAAVESGSDWLFCVDSDVVPPSDALRNLASHGVDVCFGWYAKGSGDGQATCLCKPGRDSYDSFFMKGELEAARAKGKGIVEVRGGGFGCVLVRTSVFGRIREPWFDYVWSRSGRRLSEDYHFCTQCRNAGIRLFADTRVGCGHMRAVEI